MVLLGFIRTESKLSPAISLFGSSRIFANLCVLVYIYSKVQATETDLRHLGGPASLQGHIQTNVDVAIYFGIQI